MSNSRTPVPIPHPHNWIRLLSELIEARNRCIGDSILLPPIPFSLRKKGQGAAQQIRRQWCALVTWAREHDFDSCLDFFCQHPPGYDVAEYFAQSPRPDFGPDERARPVPHTLLVKKAEQYLLRNWPKIVGIEFARSSRPVRLEGAKKRRLVIAVNPEQTPSWGSWEADAHGSQRFASTQRLINRALWPMEISILTVNSRIWSPANYGVPDGDRPGGSYASLDPVRSNL